LRGQLREFPKVLGGCGELDLFAFAFGSSEPHHGYTDVSFQLREEHFDAS